MYLPQTYGIQESHGMMHPCSGTAPKTEFRAPQRRDTQADPPIGSIKVTSSKSLCMVGGLKDPRPKKNYIEKNLKVLTLGQPAVYVRWGDKRYPPTKKHGGAPAHHGGRLHLFGKGSVHFYTFMLRSPSKMQLQEHQLSSMFLKMGGTKQLFVSFVSFNTPLHICDYFPPARRV